MYNFLIALGVVGFILFVAMLITKIGTGSWNPPDGP